MCLTTALGLRRGVRRQEILAGIVGKINPDCRSATSGLIGGKKGFWNRVCKRRGRLGPKFVLSFFAGLTEDVRFYSCAREKLFCSQTIFLLCSSALPCSVQLQYQHKIASLCLLCPVHFMSACSNRSCPSNLFTCSAMLFLLTSNNLRLHAKASCLLCYLFRCNAPLLTRFLLRNLLAKREQKAGRAFQAARHGDSEREKEMDDLLQFCANACSAQRQPFIVCHKGRVVPIVPGRTNEWKTTGAPAAPSSSGAGQRRRLLRSAASIRHLPESSDDAVAFGCGLFRAVFTTMILNLRSMLSEPQKAVASIMRGAKSIDAAYKADHNHAGTDDIYGSFGVGGFLVMPTLWKVPISEDSTGNSSDCFLNLPRDDDACNISAASSTNRPLWGYGHF